MNTGFLPPGFLAIDLAHELGLPLFDPDTQVTGSSGEKLYAAVDPTIPQQTATIRQRPSASNGLIGGTCRILPTTDAKVIVAANGGSDLIYVPDHDSVVVRRVVAFLSRQDYIGGLFVRDVFGEVPGALPMSTIGLEGSARTPIPDIAVNFKTFSLDPANPLMTATQIADSTLQEGQGMHGTLARDNTFNNMAAIGPDFKRHFVDHVPVGNSDIAITFARILGLDLPATGKLKGRVLSEALLNGPVVVPFVNKVVRSQQTAAGASTVLIYQEMGSWRYFDEACLAGAAPNCR